MAAIGVGVLVGAVGGAIVSITALGEKGSTILGVEDAFNRLATAAGSTGDALLGGLNEGVKNTIDSMVLMQSVNRALSAGVKLSADDMKVMGETARAMGKATGTDAAQGLQNLSVALTTGRVRTLAMAGIIVNVSDAEAKFAKSIGTTAKELNEAGKLEAKRLGMLDAMRAKVEQLGVSELNFKERIQQVSVSLGNWVDNLAKAVASSPNVARAFDAISLAIQKGFGVDSQKLLDKIVGWINYFADQAAKYGPIIIGYLAYIKDRIIDIWDATMKAWDSVPEWFRNIARDAALAAGGLYLINGAVTTLGGDSLTTVGSFATIVSGTRDAVLSLIAPVKAATGFIREWFLMVAVFKWEAVALAARGLGTAILGIVSTPLAAVAIAIGSIYAAFQLGKTQAVSDFFEEMALGFRGMSSEAARAAIAARRARDEMDEAFSTRPGAGIKGKDTNLSLEVAKPPILDPKNYIQASSAAADLKNELQKIREGLTGIADIQAFQKMRTALGGTIDVTKLTVAGMGQVKTAVDAAIDGFKTMGKSVPADIQKLSDALNAKEWAKNLKEIDDIWEKTHADMLSVSGKFISKWVSDSQAAARKVMDASGDALAKTIVAKAEYEEKNYQLTLKGTALTIRQLDLQRQKEIALYGPLATDEINRYYDAMIAGAVKVKSAWDKTFDAFGSAATILDNVSGKVAEIGAMAARGAQQMMTAWANQDYVGMVVAGVTTVIGVVSKLVGWANEGRKAIVAFADSFDTLAQGSGFDELHAELQRLGATGEQMWIQLTQGTPAGNAEAAKAEIEKIKAALAALDADISKYNLSWKDMADAQGGATKAGQALMDSFKRLTAAGYSSDAIIKGMSVDLNQYIVDSIKAGTKIPPAMQPIIEKLIRMGGLTEEAARAMLGLAESTMPSLADITAAAERYGISLDALGPKVKQLQITELANQYVADWKVLTAATDDWAVLFEKMGPKVQDLVTDAIKYGSELPASMKPMIQAFIDAGKLTDENGVKLTDLSKLKFAADLEDMFEKLILKLDDLIDKITLGVGGAFDTLGNKVVRPTIKPRYDGSEVPDGGGPGESEPDTPPGMATGGIVPSYYGRGGNVIAFRPRGTDTVPAMLTPGERVLTVAQNQAYEQGGKDIVISSPVNIDGMKVGESVVRVRDRMGLGR